MAEGPYYSQLPTVAVKPFGSRRHCFCQCLIVTHVCILAKDISIVFFKIQLPRLLYVPLSKIRSSVAALILSKLWYTKLLPWIFRVEFHQLPLGAARAEAADKQMSCYSFFNGCPASKSTIVAYYWIQLLILVCNLGTLAFDLGCCPLDLWPCNPKSVPSLLLALFEV